MANFSKREVWSRRECPYCELTLVNAQSLSKHIKRIHSEKRIEQDAE